MTFQCLTKYCASLYQILRLFITNTALVYNKHQDNRKLARIYIRSDFANDKMADQWREPLSGRVTARILLQQPIPVFDRVRKLSRSSADSALYRSAERPRIAALTIRVLPHGRPRIAARQPSENQRGVSAEKGKFSVSRTVPT